MNKLNHENLELKSKLLELEKQIQYFNKYQDLYSSIAKNLHKKAILEIKYINRNLNGNYVIAYSNRDVALNNIVVDNYNVFIGRVVDRYYNRNKVIVKVQLITDQRSNIPIIANGIEGIAFGNNDANCKIQVQNLTDKEFKGGDLVLTSGIDGLTIKGVIVGKIKIIDNKTCIENKNIDNFDQLVVVD